MAAVAIAARRLRRYPLVEAFVAAYFVVQWWVDVGRVASTMESHTELARGLITYLLHISLVCSLLAATLIHRDGHAVPWSLGWPLVALVVGCGVWWPDGLRSSWMLPGSTWVVWPALAGCVLGAMLATLCTDFWRRGKPSPPIILGGLSGLVLGAAAAGLLITVTAVLDRLPWFRGNGSLWPGWFTGATALYQLTGGATVLNHLLGWASWVFWLLLGLLTVSLAVTAGQRQDSAT